MFSFSSCWNSHRHKDGRAMLREIRDLGFEYAGRRLDCMEGISVERVLAAVTERLRAVR